MKAGVTVKLTFIPNFRDKQYPFFLPSIHWSFLFFFSQMLGELHVSQMSCLRRHVRLSHLVSFNICEKIQGNGSPISWQNAAFTFTYIQQIHNKKKNYLRVPACLHDWSKVFQLMCVSASNGNKKFSKLSWGICNIWAKCKLMFVKKFEVKLYIWDSCPWNVSLIYHNSNNEKLKIKKHSSIFNSHGNY